MVQLEYNAFENACVPVVAFVVKKTKIKTSGEYIKLSEFRGSENQEPKTLEAINNPNCKYRYEVDSKEYLIGLLNAMYEELPVPKSKKKKK